MRDTSPTPPPVLQLSPGSKLQEWQAWRMSHHTQPPQEAIVFLPKRGHFPKELGLHQDEQSTTRYPHSSNFPAACPACSCLQDTALRKSLFSKPTASWHRGMPQTKTHPIPLGYAPSTKVLLLGYFHLLPLSFFLSFLLRVPCLR